MKPTPSGVGSSPKQNLKGKKRDTRKEEKIRTELNVTIQILQGPTQGISFPFLPEKRKSVNLDICVVVSDMKMPGMNGIEFIKEAKEKYPRICYFILTGFEITKEITRALDDKLINNYFKKPFNMDEIESSINIAFS